MPRNKKSPEQKIAELQKRAAAIDAELKREKARLRETERKRDTRRKIIVGGLVLQHADLDPAFHAQLWNLIEKHVTRDADRETLGLDPLPHSSGDPDRGHG